VANNYIYNARKKAIQVKADKNNAVIDGNIIFVVNDTAIDVRGDNIIVSNNWISDVTLASKHGIYAEGNNIQIIGNHVENITAYGIDVEDHENNIISDNIVISANIGIALVNMQNCTVDGNIVYDLGNNGIKLQDSNFTIVSNNRVMDSSNAEIIEAGGNSDYNIFIGNIAKTITKIGVNSIKEHNIEV